MNNLNIILLSKNLITLNLIKAKNFTLKNIKQRLLLEYYSYLNIFDRLKVNAFLSYRSYNYRFKFIDNIDKLKLLKSRTYLVFDYKLK